jgi:hypothetical protein
MKMFEERLNKLEDGCGWEFKIDGETFFCGDLDYGENPIKHFCDVCDARIEEVKLCQEIQDAREQEILNVIDEIDTEVFIAEYGFRANSFKKELKSKLSQAVGK